MLSHFQTTITGILLIASRYSSPVDAFVQNPTSIAANECRGMKMPFFDPNTPKLGASPQVDQEEEIQSLVPPTKFVPLFDQAYQATLPKEADNTKNAHDPFRFEWGTWVDNEAILELMARVELSSDRAIDQPTVPPLPIESRSRVMLSPNSAALCRITVSR